MFWLSEVYHTIEDGDRDKWYIIRSTKPKLYCDEEDCDGLEHRGYEHLRRKDIKREYGISREYDVFFGKAVNERWE